MQYVALIRGIGPENPNMHGDKLKAFFEKLGFSKVIPVLSSGNVIFASDGKDSSSLEAYIEENLPKNLGFHKSTIVRSYEELKKIIHSDPFRGVEDAPVSRLNVTFLKKGGEVFSVIDTVHVGTIKIMSNLEKQHGKEITTRTWKTIGKIIKKMEENQ